jgi:hypothetical protein
MHRSVHTLILLLFVAATGWSQQYSGIINGEYVRRHFRLKSGEVVKFEEFKTKTYPTATVVWGKPEKTDDMRIKAGVAPSGSKLMVIFNEIKSEKEFDRVLGTYKDGERVTGIGRKAVWSQKWKQLSVLLSPKLLIHVHLDHPGTTNLKASLVAIARDIDKKL